MDRNEVLSVLDERMALHLNDPNVENYWMKLTDLLTVSVEETISFFDDCPEEQVLLLSEVFEDIAYRLQEISFIECLDRLQQKYPDIPIEESVKVAKQFMKKKD